MFTTMNALLYSVPLLFNLQPDVVGVEESSSFLRMFFNCIIAHPLMRTLFELCIIYNNLIINDFSSGANLFWDLKTLLLLCS